VFLRTKFPDKNLALIVDVERDQESAALLRVGEDKNLSFIAWWKHFRWADVFKSFAPGIFPGGVSVIVHPTLTHTVYIPLRFTRKKREHLLGRAQFEQFLVNAVSAAQNRYLEEAAARLSIDPLDVVMTGARLMHLAAEGQDVALSHGGNAQELEMVLEVVFIPRWLSQQWSPFFNASGGFFFHDTLHAQFEAIRRVDPVVQSVVEVGWEETSFITKDATGTKQRFKKGRIRWSLWGFSRHVGDQLGLSADAIRRIALLHSWEGLSGAAARAFSHASRPFVARLAKEIARAGLSGAVYVNAPFPLFPGERFRSEGVSLIPAPTNLIEAQLGFRVSEAGEVPLQKLFPYLASFMGFYYDKSNVGVNRFLKRRLHWLA